MVPQAAAPHQAIYRVVRAVPRGKVVTYGQLAELAGIPRGHRLAARAMHSCPKGLAWHRVVAKKDARRAQIAIQEPAHAQKQRRLLEREGVVFDAGGCIPLRAHGWLPLD
jgi:methylated-DNA-protein-cysteine methyltransferase-like protein